MLRALGIRHILARSPEARNRSERAFGTIQGRLPQELKLAGIKDYASANGYLEKTFIPDFNRRFVVRPAQPESAFIPLVALNLDLRVSVHHDRTVQKDNTVVFEELFLQLPPSKERLRYFRCPVIVHELVNRLTPQEPDRTSTTAYALDIYDCLRQSAMARRPKSRRGS